MIENLFVPEGARLFGGQPFTVYEDGASLHRGNNNKVDMSKILAHHSEARTSVLPRVEPYRKYVEHS